MMYKYAVFVICAVVSADKCADQEQSNGFVGFSASLDEVKTVTPGQTLKYTNVITNAGNHYDPDTGVFTAPRTAYYLFHIHALSHEAKFWLQLFHNEIPRASCHANYAMGGNSVLLKVKAGERVCVKAYHATSTVYGDGTSHYPTFTGHLVGL